MPTVRAMPGWTPEAVRQLCYQTAAALAGRGYDRYGVANQIQTRVGIKLLQLVQERFLALRDGDTDPDVGDSWADNAPSTIARKVARGKRKVTGRPVLGTDYQIGIDTGVMFRSLSPGLYIPHQVFEVKPGVVTVGTDLKYAEWFHKGTRRQPARPLWPARIPDRWREELARTEADAFADSVAYVVVTYKPLV